MTYHSVEMKFLSSLERLDKIEHRASPLQFERQGGAVDLAKNTEQNEPSGSVASEWRVIGARGL